MGNAHGIGAAIALLIVLGWWKASELLLSAVRKVVYVINLQHSLITRPGRSISYFAIRLFNRPVFEYKTRPESQASDVLITDLGTIRILNAEGSGSSGNLAQAKHGELQTWQRECCTCGECSDWRRDRADAALSQNDGFDC